MGKFDYYGKISSICLENEIEVLEDLKDTDLESLDVDILEALYENALGDETVPVSVLRDIERELDERSEQYLEEDFDEEDPEEEDLEAENLEEEDFEAENLVEEDFDEEDFDEEW
jgi:uncharacterized protein YjbI with pentapeptide repeats